MRLHGRGISGNGPEPQYSIDGGLWGVTVLLVSCLYHIRHASSIMMTPWMGKHMTCALSDGTAWYGTLHTTAYLRRHEALKDRRLVLQ